MLSSDLKWMTQVEIEKATKRAIAQIKNSFSYFDAALVTLLHIFWTRSHLGFI